MSVARSVREYELHIRADASYVLDWLRQTKAPPNIVALQERAVEALGGYLGPEDRIAGRV